MAHRLITQAAFTAVRVFGRAFAEAYRQANASAAYRKTTGTSAPTSTHAGLTLDEACRILNISPPKANLKKVGGEEAEKYGGQLTERFKKLFDQNDPNKGGSFYLQSKVLRARERLESEVGKVNENAESTSRAEMPKMYKDR